MAETPEFNLWLRRTHAEAAFKIDQWRDDTERWLDEEMRPENLLIEYGKT